MASKLTLDLATQLLSLAQQFAAELGKPMTIAVVDSGGHVVALHRMDGARFITAEIAPGKAYTAAAWGVPSAEMRERMKNVPNFSTALSAMTYGKHTPQTGAVPIVIDGELVGAIGASGGTGEEDEAVCKRALEKLVSKA
jgi:uncharacterized protein GlcG (DUF336 family)